MASMLSKRLGILLVGSLALNLFLAGLLLAPLLFGHDRPGKPGRIDFRAAIEELAPERRDAVREIWREHRGEMRRNFRDMRGAHDAVREALIADPFDPRALAAAHSDVAARSAEIRGIMEAAVARIAATLTAEERRKFFSKMSRNGKRRPAKGN